MSARKARTYVTNPRGAPRISQSGPRGASRQGQLLEENSTVVYWLSLLISLLVYQYIAQLKYRSGHFSIEKNAYAQFVYLESGLDMYQCETVSANCFTIYGNEWSQQTFLSNELIWPWTLFITKWSNIPAADLFGVALPPTSSEPYMGSSSLQMN